ncbi:Hypothetical predicted protein, partial [Olea europaea subsp. europaea]
ERAGDSKWSSSGGNCGPGMICKCLIRPHTLGLCARATIHTRRRRRKLFRPPPKWNESESDGETNSKLMSIGGRPFARRQLAFVLARLAAADYANS